MSDLNRLKTEDQSSYVNAINEIVGKRIIANAIGEPLNSLDKWSDMESDINSLLSTFKTNMMNNGVTVEANDRFKSLLDKIATLTDSEGKGVQFASGVTENVYGSQVNDPSNLSINVPINLDFEPTYFLICIPKIQGRMGWASYTNLLLSNFANSQTQNAHGGGGTHTLKVTMSNITTSNFLLTIYSSASGSTYGAAAEINCQITWYAIGVGEDDTTLLDSLKSILAEEGVTTTEEDDMASLITKVDEEFNEKNNEMDSLNTTITLLNNQVNSLTNELAGKVTPAGDAVAGNVLSGKTFINSTAQVVNGTMANMSTHTQVADYVTWNENSIYLGIPAGAYVNASSTGYPEVYIEKTRLDSNLVPENIVSGKSICGVTGSVKSPSSLATTGDVSKTSKTYTNCIQLILNSSPLITVSSQSSNIIEKYKFTSTVSGRIALLMNFSNQYTGSYAANAIFHIYKNDSLITSLTQVQVSGNGWVYPSSTSSNTINCFVNLISDTFTVAKNDVISIRVETYGSGWGDKIARCYSIAVLGVFA